MALSLKKHINTLNLNLKIIIISVLLCFPLFTQAQEDKKIYTSTNILEIYKNTEGTLIHQQNKLNKGWGFELNSLHGIFILKKFRKISISKFFIFMQFPMKKIDFFDLKIFRARIFILTLKSSQKTFLLDFSFKSL